MRGVDDLRHLAARVLCCGFTDPIDLAPLLNLGLGGVVLFGRNEGHWGRLPPVPLVATDHEGGRVQRFRGGDFTPIPAMRLLGERGDPGLARDVGRLMGLELRAAGINLNFAPVVDVDTNPLNPVIADRSLGRDPTRVGRLAAALVDGLQSAGVAACCKHFPGHGDTAQDSHTSLPRLSHDMERLRRIELPPFRATRHAAAVMTAHVVFDAIDPAVPATLSPAAIGLLRGEIGFGGLVVSDDLEMAAVADTAGVERAAVRAAVRAVAAGVDLVLICHRPDRQRAAHAALVAAVEAGALPIARLREAAGRVDALAARFPRGPAEADPGEFGRLRRQIQLKPT